MEFLKNMMMFDADGGNGGSNSSEVETNNDGEANADSKNTDKTIPYERFKEVNDNYKNVKKQLDDFIQEREQAELEAKETQGEFETLYNELKEKHEPISKEFEAYKETFQSILKTKLESVPEEYKDLIPKGNELEQLKWIEGAQAKGLFKKENLQSFGNDGNNPENNDDKKANKGFLKGLSRFNQNK